MNNIETRTSSSNSLLPMSFLVIATLGNSIQEIPKPDIFPMIEVKYTDVTNVFSHLPDQNITFEQNQMDILRSFVSKLVNESKDLEGEIVDMVNRNFEELLLKL